MTARANRSAQSSTRWGNSANVLPHWSHPEFWTIWAAGFGAGVVLTLFVQWLRGRLEGDATETPPYRDKGGLRISGGQNPLSHEPYPGRLPDDILTGDDRHFGFHSKRDD